jgi:hypothetical protein
MPPAREVVAALENEEKCYHFNLLRELFDFQDTCAKLLWLRKLWRDNLEEIYAGEYVRLLEMIAKVDDCKGVATTFRVQLSRIESSVHPDMGFLNERLNKASGYFLPVFEEIRTLVSSLSGLEIDNKDVRKKVREAMEEVLTELDIKCEAMGLAGRGQFNADSYGRVKTDAVLKDRSVKPSRNLKKIIREEGEPGVVNEELREKLQEWRSARFKADNVPAYTVMHQSTLMEIASLIPKTKAELLAIKGFGKAKYEKYGEEILNITSEF